MSLTDLTEATRINMNKTTSSFRHKQEIPTRNHAFALDLFIVGSMQAGYYRKNGIVATGFHFQRPFRRLSLEICHVGFG